MAEYYDSRNPYRPLPSLASVKASQLATRLADKQEKLQPQPRLSDADIQQIMGQEESGYGDLAEAALLRSVYNLGDLVTGRTVDPNIVSQIADETAGVSPELRARETAKQDAVLQSLARGDYGTAAIDAIKAAPGVLSDSASTVPEIALGSLLTGLVPGGQGAGAALLGRRAKKAVDTVKSVKNRYEKIADQVKRVAKMSAQAAGQTSILTADIMQQQRNEYKAQYGEDMPIERLAAGTALTMLTTAWQPAMIRNLYVPKGKQFVGKNVKEKFENEVKSLIKRAERGTAENLTQNVVQGAKRVAAAGGAEAVQEYAQSWAEILSVHYGKDQTLNALSTAFEAYGDKTLQSLFLGGAAGATMRGATAAPAVAGKSTYDVAVGIEQKAAQAAAKRAQSAAEKILPQSDLEKIQEDFKTDKAVSKKLFKANTKKAKQLMDAVKFEDVKNEEIQADLLVEAGDQNLSDPKVFKKMQERVYGKYRAQVVQSEVKFRTKAAVKTAGVAGKETVKAAADLVGITQEDVDKVITKAKTLGVKAVDELKNYNKSTTYAMMREGVAYGEEQSKENLQALKKSVVGNTPKTIRKFAKTIGNAMPETAAILKEEAAKIEDAQRVTGVKKDRLVDTKDLSLTTRRIAQIGKVDKDPEAVGQNIVLDGEAEFENTEVTGILKKAIAAYEKTDLFKNQEEGSYSPARINAIKDRIANFESAQKEKVTAKAKAKVQKFYEDQKTVLEEKTKEGTEAAKQKTKDFAKTLDTWIADLVKGKPDTESVADTIESYAIKRNKAGENFLRGVAGSTQFIAQSQDSADAKVKFKNLFKAVTSKQALQKLSELYETTDPAALRAIIAEHFPPIAEKKYDKRVAKAMSEALEGVDKKPAPPTVQRTVTEDDAGTGQFSVDPEDDGRFYVDKDLSNNRKEVTNVIKRAIRDKICD